MAQLPDPHKLGPFAAAETLKEIQEALWRGGDADHEWSPDTLDEIAKVMHNAGLGPETKT